MRYVILYTNPCPLYCEVTFGYWDKQFAKDVLALIPDEWKYKYGGLHKGRLYVTLKPGDYFEKLVKLVESMPNHGEVKFICKEWEGAEKLLNYKHIKE